MRQSRVALGLGVFCLLIAILAGTAVGQEKAGTLNGVAADTTGAVLPDVTVTATNKESGRVTPTTSGSDGSFVIRNLEPGRYSVKFERQGFSTAEFPDVLVLLGQNVKLDAKMAVGGIQTEVQVTDVAPLIDTQSNLVAHNITSEEFDRLPKGRSFQALMNASPSVNSGQDTFGNIVGVEGGIQVNGASSAENQFFIDGVATNSQLYGQSRQNAAFEFLQEVQVKTGGTEAEYGGALGGVMTATTKSGGDEFHGDVHYYFTGNGIAAAPVKRLLSPLVVGTTGYNTIGSSGFVQDKKQVDNRNEAGGSIGGPIMKGKAWFFVSASPTWRRREQFYNFRDANNNSVGTDTIKQKRLDQQAFAKINYDLTPRIKTSWSVLFTPTVSTGNPAAYNGDSNAVVATVASFQARKQGGFFQPQTNYTGSIDITPTNSTLLSIRGGRFWDNYKVSGVPKLTTWEYGNSTTDLAPNLQSQVPAGGMGFGNSPRLMLVDHDLIARTFVDADYTIMGKFFGSHDFKTGWGISKSVNNVDNSYPNNGYITIYWGQAFTSAVTGSPCSLTPCSGTYGYYQIDDNGTKGSTGGTINSIYFQDKWSPSFMNRVTFNLGLRLENEKVPSFRRSIKDPAFQFGFGDKIMPRLGVAYDVFGNGKMKAGFSYSRTYDWVKYELARGTFGGDIWTTKYRALDTTNLASLNAQNLPGRDLWDPSVPNSFQDHRIPSFSTDCSATSLATCQVDPSLKPMGADLYNANVEYQWNRTVIRVGYVHNQLLHAIEDMGVLINGSENYLYVNPGEGLLGQVMNINYPATKAPSSLCQSKLSGNDLANCLAGKVFPTPKAQRKYDALELSATRRFSEGWFFDGSLVISRLWGNYCGIANCDEIRTPTTGGGFGPGQQQNTQLSRQGTSASRAWDLDQIMFDSKGNLDVLGRLPSDRPAVLKIDGSYHFRFGTEVGAFFNASSGTPITTYAFTTDRIGMRIFGRGDLGRTPVLTQTDAVISHTVNVAENKSLRFEFNMTNLFNQKTARHIYNCLNPDCVNGLVPSGMNVSGVNLFTGFDPKALIAASSNGAAAFDPRYQKEDLWNPGFQGRFGVKFTF